jgi:hypothetical protein
MNIKTRRPVTKRAKKVVAVTARHFDLNIEKVLDGWEVSHAIREIIANALDESVLTSTKIPEIVQRGSDRWVIRDLGRGLRYQHLTQNENTEKRRREREMIGRFGVGLKDALAVLDRRSVRVQIRSSHGLIDLVHRPKAGFADVTTLHARVAASPEPRMRGTEVELQPVSASDVQQAKQCFMRYSADSILEETQFGQILRTPRNRTARIYVNGLVVAEEPNFAFSYNVTSLTKAMRKALNRERTNVGRTAYADRIKAMLMAAESEQVAAVLAQDLEGLAAGTARDELKNWTDVGVRACQILNAKRAVVFVTSDELLDRKELVDNARRDGKDVITVPATIADKLGGLVDIAGQPLQSLTRFAVEYAESIEFKFVRERDLTAAERNVFSHLGAIAQVGGGTPKNVREVLVSETMRPSIHEGMHPAGLWEASAEKVIIHRPVLRDLRGFAGTVLHEFAHARSGHPDVSRDFELALTDVIGILAASLVGNTRSRSSAV